jgi:hypothetical protein
MKAKFLWIFLITLNSAWAQEPIARVLKTSVCSLTIVNRPMYILAGDYTTSVGGLMLASRIKSRRERVLPVGKVLLIAGPMNERQLLIKDKVITTACLSLDGINCTELNKVTFAELESFAQNNVEIKCRRSTLPFFRAVNKSFQGSQY